jgi:hypothetical protein
MVLTLNRWVHQNKEQTEQVKLLVQTLKESEEQKEREHQVLRQKLEAMTIEVFDLPLSIKILLITQSTHTYFHLCR